MSSLKEEGKKIAQRLGQGVTYKGPWLPYGPKGEFLGHFFQDDAVTGTSFAAKTFEEAKASLIKARKAFGAKPPVFANNPGNTLIAREEWDRAFLRVLPVASLAIGVFGVAITVMTLQRYGPLGQKVYSENGRYMVSVRHPGQWHEIREFVTPNDPAVQEVYSQIGPDSWGCLQWVCSQVDYRRDIGEYWQTPSETLRGYGDCEDTSILLTSLLRNFTNAYVALGSFQGYGHAWVAKEGQIYETTYTRARLVPDPENYCPYSYFNESELIELWPGALGEIFELQRNEELKLNLMAEVLADHGL